MANSEKGGRRAAVRFAIARLRMGWAGRYFEKNDLGAYSLNNLTAKPNPDGSFTVQFGGCTRQTSNRLPIMPGWHYTMRLYRPRREIIDGAWKFPEAQPVR
jgi:hypothetical protein